MRYVNFLKPGVLCRCDDVNSREFVPAPHVGSGYTTHFERTPPEENYSMPIGDGYTRHFSRDSDEDVSAITRSQLRPGHFGGIAQRRRRNEFGRGPSTLLTGDGCLTTNYADDDVETSSGRGLGVRSNNDGLTRHLSLHSADDNEDIGDFNLRPGRFGGISEGYRNVFGRGPSTLLTGRHGFLTSSSVAPDDAETNPRRRGVGSVDAAASQQSNGGGAVLAALKSWRRRQFSRNQMDMQLPEWLRNAEPEEERQRESVLDTDDSGSGRNNAASQLLSSTLCDDQDIRVADSSVS